MKRGRVGLTLVVHLGPRWAVCVYVGGVERGYTVGYSDACGSCNGRYTIGCVTARCMDIYNFT